MKEPWLKKVMGLRDFANGFFNISLVKKQFLKSECWNQQEGNRLHHFRKSRSTPVVGLYIWETECSHKHPIWKVSMIPQDQANITSLQSQAGELEGRGVLTSSREENSCNVSEAHQLLNWANQAYSRQSPGRASSPEAPDVVKKRWETTRSDLNRRFQRQFPSSKEDVEYSLLPALSVGQCIFLLTRTDATIWCFPNFSTTQLTENGNI